MIIHLTLTLVDLTKSALAFGKTTFRIFVSSRYFLIVLKTLIAASCIKTVEVISEIGYVTQ